MIAIDPGTTKSAYIVYHDGAVLDHGIVDNAEMRLLLLDMAWAPGQADVAIEMIASYGMAVGKEVFETVLWIGRLMEAAIASGCKVTLVYRGAVKSFLCHSQKANDASIRCALIDLFGGSKEKAIGKKKNPGPLYGIKADEWSALAIAVTFQETCLTPV